MVQKVFYCFISNSVSNSFFDKFAMVKWHYWYTQFGLFLFLIFILPFMILQQFDMDDSTINME